jgi:Ca2+-transporting ATPase
MDKKWHNLSPDEVLLELSSRHSGLTGAEVRERILKYGANELTAKKKTPPALVFLRQFLSPLIYVLIIAVVISFIVGKFIDAGVITGVLLANAIIGFIQETRAEKAMEALVRLAAPRAKVRRNGRIKLLPARELVPGDILLLETGDRVPVDARLVGLANLKANEATLTGESMPADKQTSALDEDTPVAERANLVHMGTVITYGRATAIVTGTGMSTEIGKITTVIQEVKHPKTPIQKSISQLSRYLMALFLGASALIVIMGLIRGLDWLELFLLAVAAAVSAIPEGLPAVVTIVLAIGMRTLARRNAIVRKLVAVETLGSATVICSDKTGTLTLNEITVRRLYANGQWTEVSGEGYQPRGEFRHNGQTTSPDREPGLARLLKIGALCNDAQLSGDDEQTIYGDPTDGALLVAAAKAGMDKEGLEAASPRLDEIPF